MVLEETELSDGSRRGAILAGALAAFTENGVSGASIDEIRHRSRASVGSIYHHFPGGKDEIAGSLYVEGLEHYQIGFVETLTRAQSARAGVEGAVEHHLSWVVENRDLTRFILLGRDARVVVASERPLRDINQHFFADVRRWMKPLVESGDLRDLSTEVVTALWIGPSQEVARHWLAGHIESTPTDMTPLLAAAAWRSLGIEKGPRP